MRIGATAVVLYQDQESCAFRVGARGKQGGNNELHLRLRAPCDVMTLGPDQAFAPEVRGLDQRGVATIRVVGSLQWIQELRGECGKEWVDVRIDLKKETVSLLQTENHGPPLLCPRSWNMQVHW